MKKTSILIGIIISIIFSYQLNSQSLCPTGYSSTTKTYTINGCDFQAEFCYNCPTSHPFHIRVTGFTKLDPLCNPSPSITSGEILQELTDLISKDYQTINSLCTNGQIPPCDPLIDPYVIEVGENLCWKKEALPNGTIEYWACNWFSAYCYTQWHLCFDSQGKLQRTLYIGPMWSGDPNDCPDAEPSDPPIGQETGCFYINTRCN